MQNKIKTARFFSSPLMKQNIRSNWALTVIITVIMCLMVTVVSFAMSILGNTEMEDNSEAQTEFFSHLFALATYNQMAGGRLSAEDFMSVEDKLLEISVFRKRICHYKI